MKEHSEPAQVKLFGKTWQPTYATAQKLSIFGGLIGLNQFYVGDIWLGILKVLLTLSVQGIPISATWWIVDAILIRTRKNNWQQWIGAKQAKRDEKLLNKAYYKKAAIEGKALMEERKKSGKCTSCGSDKLQAVAETNSQAQLTDAFSNILPRGNTHLEQKVRSKTMIVCLNCGFKRQI